jgi:hypothetical protein
MKMLFPIKIPLGNAAYAALPCNHSFFSERISSSTLIVTRSKGGKVKKE